MPFCCPHNASEQHLTRGVHKLDKVYILKEMILCSDRTTTISDKGEAQGARVMQDAGNTPSTANQQPPVPLKLRPQAPVSRNHQRPTTDDLASQSTTTRRLALFNSKRPCREHVMRWKHKGMITKATSSLQSRGFSACLCSGPPPLQPHFGVVWNVLFWRSVCMV